MRVQSQQKPSKMADICRFKTAAANSGLSDVLKKTNRVFGFEFLKTQLIGLIRKFI